MIALVLAVCCSLAIGMIFKHTERQGIDRVALLTVNYAAAVLTGALLLAGTGRAAELAPAPALAPEAALLALGGGVGVLLIAGFFLLALATDVAGMALALGVMRVSVVIPTLASWLVWSEPMSVPKGLGLALGGAAFFLVAHRRRGAPGAPGAQAGSGRALDLRVAGLLALLFCAGGAVDLSMKVFEEHFAAASSKALFLLMAFGAAFAVGAGVVLWRRRRRGAWPGRAVLGWGVLLGVINYGSLAFLLRAIQQLSGTFVFPVNNIAIVIGGALLGVGLWGEHLSRLNMAGLALAAAALVLLSVG